MVVDDLLEVKLALGYPVGVPHVGYEVLEGVPHRGTQLAVPVVLNVVVQHDGVVVGLLGGDEGSQAYLKRKEANLDYLKAC